MEYFPELVPGPGILEHMIVVRIEETNLRIYYIILYYIISYHITLYIYDMIYT